MTTKKKTIGVLTFFATVIIPIMVWASGFVPEFAEKEELERLSIEQLDLRQEYLNDKYLILRKDQRQLQQKIYDLEQTEKPVPEFYLEELENTAQDLDRLQLRLNETQSRKESLKSTD